MAREEFRALDERVYIDVASRAPMADRVAVAVEGYLEVCRLRGADKEHWYERAESIRGTLAHLLGAGTDEIAFTKNTSDGLNTLALALDLKAGDNVVLCPEFEHANNVYPWLNLRRHGIEVRSVAPRAGDVDLDSVRLAIDERTRVVTLSSVSSMTGGRPDLAAVAELCRPRGIFVLVDAAQSLGIVDTDLESIGIDGLVGATQKGLLSMYGLGVLYCRRAWLDRLEPPFLSVPSIVREGLHESDLGDITDYRVRDSAARFETGNYNFAGLFALEAALTFYDDFSPSSVEAHVGALATRLIDGLDALGLPVITPRQESRRAGIVVTEPPEVAELARHLTAEGIQVAVRRGRLRASFHLYNNDDDVDRLLDGIAGAA